MASTAKEKGPQRANASSLVSHTLTQGNENMQTHNTAPADPASAATYLADDIDNVRDMTQTVCHQLHFLMQDLERSLSFDRGEPFGKGGIKLAFQQDGIDATLWLLSETWSTAKSLDERIELHVERIREDAIAAERRAAA